MTLILLVSSPFGKQDAIAARNRAGRSEPKAVKMTGRITETAPPSAIAELRQVLEDNQPQVSILSPKPNEVLSDNAVSLRFQVRDLPIFKDAALGLGPHLHVFLDNQPYQAVYDLSKPLELDNLSPGTHMIRAFASRPWHESFKNEGSYAQLVFHVFAKTGENNPDAKLPLLTYSRPQVSYGAEPILLDFYLTNAPLHLVAQEDAKDDIADWRIRATVNGESFVIDRWQPLYLKGFKPGKNWVQLEFLDEKGDAVPNVFNNTVRLITYEPNGNDTLAKLTRGDLSAKAARGIVDPDYVPKPASPEPASLEPTVPSLEPTIAPPIAPEPPTSSKLPAPSESQTPAPTSTDPHQTELPQAEIPEPVPSPIAPIAPTPVPPQPKPGFFSRLRRPATAPVVEPSPAVTPTPESIAPPKTVPPEGVPPEIASPENAPSETVSPEPIQSPEAVYRDAPEPIVEEPPALESPTPAPSGSIVPPEISLPDVPPAPIPPASAPALSEPQSSEPAEPIAKRTARFFDRFRPT